MSDDLISRQDAIYALWKALFEYEDKTEKQFQESEDLDVGDWIVHRGFVQNMSDIDRQTILNLPTADVVDKERYDRLLKNANILAEAVRKYQTADVVEVVRCKHCEHRDAETGFCEGRGWPMQLVHDDGFCDKGRKRKK